MQQPRQCHLLLVAARQLDRLLLRTSATDPEALEPGEDRGPAARQAQPARLHIGPQPAVGNVVGNRLRQGQSFLFAVLAEQADARRDALARRGTSSLLALDPDLAADRRLQAEQGAQRLGPPGPDQAED